MPGTCFYLRFKLQRYQGPLNSSITVLDLIFEIAIIGHRFSLLLSIPKFCGYVNPCCVVIDGQNGPAISRSEQGGPCVVVVVVA